MAKTPTEVQQGHMPEEMAALAPPHVARKLERIASADYDLVEAFQTRHQGYFDAKSGGYGMRPAAARRRACSSAGSAPTK